MWKTELRQSLKSIKDINLYFNTELSDLPYEVNIPLHIAKQIKDKPNGILAKQFMPTLEEINNQDEGFYDPIGDILHSKPGKIVHRYYNRLLFFPTTTCPIICRYCFRKNELSNKDQIFKDTFQKTLEYLEKNNEVNEIIFSGGDPFVIDDEKLKYYLDEFKKVKNIRYIRFHTRVPATLPSRITDDLINLLQSYETSFKIIIAIHINHMEEVSQYVENKLKILAATNFELLSQTVLLRNINDNVDALEKLFSYLSDHRIRPYYLHHPDKVKGGMHFYLSHKEGKIIYEKLRKRIPGWQLPHYIYDQEKGLGKTTFF